LLLRVLLTPAPLLLLIWLLSNLLLLRVCLRPALPPVHGVAVTLVRVVIVADFDTFAVGDKATVAGGANMFIVKSKVRAPIMVV